MNLVNSTVTGNRDAEIGAGIFSSGSVSLVYSTVVGNSADVAFSNIDSQQLSSFGSVVAGGVATQDSCLGTPTSFGYNFSDDLSCGFTQPTDRQDAGSPGLGELANNGGPTRTMLPAAASPLVNAIPPASCQADGAAGITADQRGIARPQGTGCDIGAVEAQIVVPVVPVVPLTPVAGADRDRAVVHRLTRARLRAWAPGSPGAR